MIFLLYELLLGIRIYVLYNNRKYVCIKGFFDEDDKEKKQDAIYFIL